MAKKFTKKERKAIEEWAKEKGLKVLSKKEHKELVKGKKIVFSRQAIEDLKRLSENKGAHNR